GQIVGNPEAESGKSGYVASVGGELLHLLTADQGTDLAGFSLSLQRVGLHGNRQSGATHLEGDVFFEGLGNVDDDAGLGKGLEARSRRGQRIGSDGEVGETISADGVRDLCALDAGGGVDQSDFRI